MLTELLNITLNLHFSSSLLYIGLFCFFFLLLPVNILLPLKNELDFSLSVSLIAVSFSLLFPHNVWLES